MATIANTFVALLRGINVGGKNKIPMAELRSVVEACECDTVRSYIQSGNLVFASRANRVALESDIEQAITREFGLSIPVLVRTAALWAKIVAQNPFENASETTPNWLQLLVAKRTPVPDAETVLQERATRDERVIRTDDAIWVHYPNGIGKSRLTPAVMDRSIGSTVTARNWKTALKIHALATAGDASG